MVLNTILHQFKPKIFLTRNIYAEPEMERKVFNKLLWKSIFWFYQVWNTSGKGFEEYQLLGAGGVIAPEEQEQIYIVSFVPPGSQVLILAFKQWSLLVYPHRAQHKPLWLQWWYRSFIPCAAMLSLIKPSTVQQAQETGDNQGLRGWYEGFYVFSSSWWCLTSEPEYGSGLFSHTINIR